ncbi:MAG: HNH endonuclease [Halobacteriovoraceae bacterium]|jgi:hypothetical protein|nr:HNH endonuclease [Halobacteriovoraceae bacterium]
MTLVDINNYTREEECLYNGEKYSVRDNGSVLRHAREGKRARANDNKWTFGRENTSNPYLHISNARIHRIVATAFHGDPPDSKYVVDHIDTNCRNNRPENLRWLTRLENSLKNPVTRKKIEYLCGSIEAFLENPSMLNNLQVNPSFAWMRTVTPEEAQNCKNRMNLWANSNKKTKSKSTEGRSSFTKRIYKPLKKWEVFGREPGLELACTSLCAQYMWRASAYFPKCPEEFGSDPLKDYFQNLKLDSTFAYSNNNDICPKLTLLKSEILGEKGSIIVMCKREDQRFSVIGITLDRETNYFIHFYLGSCLNKEDAENTFLKLKSSKDWWGASLSIPSQHRV